MNPITLLTLLFVLGKPSGGKGILPSSFKVPRLPVRSSYIDTFKMELLLDRLHSMTNTLEKVNHLNQMKRIPGRQKGPNIDQLQESLDVVKGFLADSKTGRKVENLSNTINGAKKLTDMEDLMQSMGPILSMLKSNQR